MNEDIKKGSYYDNAGGFHIDDIQNAFIQGLSNIDPSINSIGGFAMGGTKAIYYFSDDTSIITALSGEIQLGADINEEWMEEVDNYKIDKYEIVKN